ncbi:MAG TPA: ion channel [Acidobacteriaceae bacterium]|nr:ion channel [Acidobacteriaceae bacterium]
MTEQELPPKITKGGDDSTSDLGFGRVVSEQRQLRLLNRDGTFNVQRRGRGLHSFLSYSNLVSTSWSRFFLFVAIVYLTLNGCFAVLYTACGPGGLVNTLDTEINQPFLKAFFFSIHTSATIGYGSVVPVGIASNILVALESVVSLLGLAVVTGLVFARFSRPVADILFSQNALMSWIGNNRAFEFRIINTRNNQIIDLHVRVLVSRFERNVSGSLVRRYYPLSLERESVVFFPLSWTIVHIIDKDSPLYGVTADELCASGAEFLILLTGMDETFSQVVNARSSYRANEVIWDAKFSDIFVYDPEGRTAGIDMNRFHDTVRLSNQP